MKIIYFLLAFVGLHLSLQGTALADPSCDERCQQFQQAIKYPAWHCVGRDCTDKEQEVCLDINQEDPHAPIVAIVERVGGGQDQMFWITDALLATSGGKLPPMACFPRSFLEGGGGHPRAVKLLLCNEHGTGVIGPEKIAALLRVKHPDQAFCIGGKRCGH